MDSSETITIHTLKEDELSFFSYLLEDRDIRVIPSRIGLAGPDSLSLDEIAEIRETGSPDAHSLLIWNTSIETPLTWSPFLSWYDAHWTTLPASECSRFKPDGSSPWVTVRSVEDYCKVHASFRREIIDDRLFAHGMIATGLSPVIELSLPLNDRDFLSMDASFFESYGDEVWLLWNQGRRCWEHELVDPEILYDSIREQLPAFLDWQKRVFDWVRNEWGHWIIPRFTYRSGTERIKPEILGQILANLTGKRVLGIEPQPPVSSPRDDEQSNEAKSEEPTA